MSSALSSAAVNCSGIRGFKGGGVGPPFWVAQKRKSSDHALPRRGYYSWATCARVLHRHLDNEKFYLYSLDGCVAAVSGTP